MDESSRSVVSFKTRNPAVDKIFHWTIVEEACDIMIRIEL